MPTGYGMEHEGKQVFQLKEKIRLVAFLGMEIDLEYGRNRALQQKENSGLILVLGMETSTRY